MARTVGLNGCTPEFQRLLNETPAIAQKPDGTYRDLSRQERVNMALCAWLKKALREAEGESASDTDGRPHRFGHV